MARSLMEIIRERKQKKTEQEAVPQFGTTKAFQETVQAKTGKVSQRGAILSTETEALAIQQAQEQQKQRRYATQLAFDQQTQREEAQRFEQAQTTQRQSLQYQQVNFEMQQKVRGILDSQIEAGIKLDLDKSRARAETVGFMMRLTNDKYIDNLKAEGMKSRLDNKLEFDEALQRSIFSEELEMFENDLNFRRLMSADEREFEKELAAINIDFALRIAGTEAEARATGVMFSGLSGAVSGGLQAYSAYKKGQAVDQAKQDTEKEG